MKTGPERIPGKRIPGFALKRLRAIPQVLVEKVRSYRLALAAFLVPVFIRSIPEILVGSYPTGMGHHRILRSQSLDWAAGKAGFTEIIGTVSGIRRQNPYYRDYRIVVAYGQHTQQA